MGQLTDFGGKRPERFGRHTPLARFPIQVDLEAHVQGRELCWPLRIEAKRELEAVNTVHPMEQLGDVASLVRLQGADKVPHEPLVIQLVDLEARLLEVALPKMALSAGDGLPDGLAGLALAHRKQSHAIRRAAVAALGQQDLFTHPVQANGDALGTWFATVRHILGADSVAVMLVAASGDCPLRQVSGAFLTRLLRCARPGRPGEPL